MALEALLDKLSLSCECVDRLYLNAYIPNIQCGGQVVGFLRNRGAVVPSPALLNQMTRQFIQLVDDFMAQQGIPVVRFVKGECKEEVARPYFKRLIEQGRSSGVAMVGIAQRNRPQRKSAFDRGPVCEFQSTGGILNIR